MKKLLGVLSLILAILAFVGFYLVRDYQAQLQIQLAAAEAARKAIVPTQEVLVAKRRLRYGEPITPNDVRVVRWPSDAIPNGAFLSADDLFPEGSEVVRSALRDIEPSEAFMEIKVSEPGEEAGIAALLSEGMRAFSLQSHISTGVSGFLRPGDRIDVYWTGRVNDSEITKLLLTSVRIIDLDVDTSAAASEPTVVVNLTVEVDAEDAAKLAQAVATGRVSLSLVGASDDVSVGSVEVDLSELLGIEMGNNPSPSACFIRQRTGEDIITIEIPCNDVGETVPVGAGDWPGPRID